MTPAIQFVRRAVQSAWWALRYITGDAAYDNYLRYCETHRPAAGGAAPHGIARPGTAIMTREQFYTDRLRRKYSGVSRCC
jgi:uncharacterized short protein YbdD (DUF466 family)